MEFGQQKDAKREEQRVQMQKTIDDLLAQIEAEKQNMGAAGKKREEELLAKILALRQDLSLRDTAIKEHLNTVDEQN